MLWLALHFPLLPLEAIGNSSQASAVVWQGRVVVANDTARARGVDAGLRLAGALGRCPGLVIFMRNPAREEQHRHALACWLGQFSAQISLAEPAMILLEIGASLRLFGGVSSLVARILDGCLSQGARVAAAVAPTPLGASWLAMARQSDSDKTCFCLDDETLRARLAALPPSVTGWPEAILMRLQSFGLHSLGGLLGLPPAALSGRLSPDIVIDLERALGERHDPRPLFVFPESFDMKIEFPSRVESAEGLLFGASRLLSALSGWLARRGAGTTMLVLLLHHDDRSSSRFALRLAELTRDEQRFIRLLREHLGRWTLPAPVLSLDVRVEQWQTLPGFEEDLFATGQNIRENALVCLERLAARLGNDKVYILRAREDHRPECATACAHPGGQDAPLPAGIPDRPFWLLAEPQALAERQGRPWQQGELHLLRGPERIESGWWDEGESRGDVRRDYFTAEDQHGRILWIFRNASGWYLHGVFG